MGHLLHVAPEYGRYTGRVYTTRDIADLAGQLLEILLAVPPTQKMLLSSLYLPVCCTTFVGLGFPKGGVSSQLHMHHLVHSCIGG